MSFRNIANAGFEANTIPANAQPKSIFRVMLERCARPRLCESRRAGELPPHGLHGDLSAGA
jgi:hypothetical protein